MAAKAGGGNPEENLALRCAIDDARSANMPNDTIDKAIKKGTGELGAASYENITYEGYGPGGVAFLVECLTDNRSRTAPELRKIFERSGGQLGSTNCVAWMFEKRGTICVSAADTDEDRLMDLAVEAGADDVRRDGDEYEIICQPAAYSALKAAIESAEFKITSASLTMLPTATVAIDAQKAPQVLGLMEALEDHDDVQNVYANFDIPDKVLAEYGHQ